MITFWPLKNVAKINCELERYDKARIYIRNIVYYKPGKAFLLILYSGVFIVRLENYLDAIKAYKKSNNT